MQQNIVLSIQDRLQQLPKSERKIAEYILKNTETVISMNAQELAKQAGSSPAAIIRFCHSMDVNGFTELKLLLSANLGQMKQQMYTEVTKGESTADIKQKLQARFVNEAVDLLEKTEVIFVYGLGASSLVAQDIYQKFTRLGRTVFTTLDHHLFASMLGSTEKPSVFIVISNSGTNKEASTLADLAKQQGIPIVSITQDEKSVIGEKSDIVLQTSSGEDVPLRSAATVSLVAQLYVVDVLFFAYAAKNYKETLEKIQISRKNVERLKE